MAVYVAIGVIVPTFLLWLLITYLWRRHIIKRHSLGKQTTKAPYSLTCVECKGKFLGSYVDTYEKQRSLAIGEGWEI
ncbi:MAG: hypothetical protein KAR06_09955 [Deltaproteobacteria bacterium]|nr:hypothetical protein [Deltaproteobacteria bacterium]